MHTVHKVFLGLSIALVIFGFVCNIIVAVSTSFTVYVTPLIVYVLTLYYSFFAYKTPHGNMLKLVMLFFSGSLVSRILTEAALLNFTSLIIIPLSMLFIAYIAGRLDRINENRFYMVIVLLLLIYESIHTCIYVSNITSLSVIEYINVFEPCIIWVALASAYFSRYLEHKLAGLQDKQFAKNQPLD